MSQKLLGIKYFLPLNFGESFLESNSLSPLSLIQECIGNCLRQECLMTDETAEIVQGAHCHDVPG
ncbi:MAG: hypothetical protein IPK04_06925 [Bdellovibrionales bacterium]|nr:hypothetical protein [Bdellovibrionales bacterium]